MTWLPTFIAFIAGFMTCAVCVLITFLISTTEIEKHNRRMADEMAAYLDRSEKVKRRNYV